MATDVERLVLDMSADVRKFEAALNRANNIANKRLTAIERQAASSLRKVETSAESMGESLRTAIAGVAVAAAIREVAGYADAWTNAANKLSSAGVASADLAATQERLVRLAIETRSSLDATTDLYARLTRSTSELGVSQMAVARATEVSLKAFKSSGQTAAEAESSVTQLGQALASGVLQGDELRSIRENSTTLAQAIAKEFGVTVGELKKLGEEGELTSARVFKAILSAGGQIDAQFAKTNGTIADAFTNLETRFTAYVAGADKATAATEIISGFVNGLANNLEGLGEAAVIAAAIIGGTLAGQAVAKAVAGFGVMTARAGLTSAAITTLGRSAAVSAASMNLLRGAMAFFGGPIGLAITAVAAAVGLLAVQQAKLKTPTEAVQKATDDLSSSLQAYEDAALAASLATGKDKESALEAVKAKRALAVESLNVARAQMQEAKSTLANLAARNATSIANDRFSARGDAAGSIAPIVNAGAMKQARTNADAAAKALADAERTINRIDESMSRPLTSPTTGGGGGKGDKAKGPTGPTAAELAERKRDLEISLDLEAARLSGNLDLERSLQRQADIFDLTRQYQDAGLKAAEAQAKAVEQVTRLEEAQAVGDERAILTAKRENELEAARIRQEFEAVRALEQRQELEKRTLDYQERGYDATSALNIATAELEELERARLDAARKNLEILEREHELALAAAAGDELRVRQLERQEEIRRRSLRLQEDQRLDPAAADARATEEVRQLDEAALRGQFRAAFRDGVTAALEGDLAGAIQDWAASFGEGLVGRASDMLADVLFDNLSSLFPDLMSTLAENGGDLAAAATMSTAIQTAATTGAATLSASLTATTATGAATLATAITGSGATVAGAIGTAIVTAGAAAAQAMAAAIVAASAGGDAASSVGNAIVSAISPRARGGSFMRGQAIRTQELGPEPIIPTSAGVVFSTAAMQGLANLGKIVGNGGGLGGGEMRLEVNNYGPPARVETQKGSDGTTKVNLIPLGESMIDGAGQSGRLRKALAKSPKHKTRG